MMLVALPQLSLRSGTPGTCASLRALSRLTERMTAESSAARRALRFRECDKSVWPNTAGTLAWCQIESQLRIVRRIGTALTVLSVSVRELGAKDASKGLLFL